MRLLLIIVASVLCSLAARAQSTSQVYTFLAPFEGDSATVVHRGNGEVVVGLGHDLPRGTPRITFSVNQRRCLFLGDYHKAMRAVHLFAPDYDHLPQDAKLVLTSVYWTCGTRGLMSFRRMRYAIQHRMWSMAAYELADSRREHQISPHRARVEYDMLSNLTH